MPEAEFDEVDRRILQHLQQDGRIANVDLAEQVRLSPSSTLRRTRALEAAGVIKTYRAELDRHRLGLITVFIGLQIQEHSRESGTRIEEALRALPQVIACHVTSGETDFLIEAVVPDLEAYDALLIDHVFPITNITTARSTFAIRTAFDRAPLPVHTLHR